jgi:Tfp pilus assembly protein FimT
MSYHGFSQLLLYQKQKQVMSTTFHALQYAKQEAVHQRQIIRVGPLANDCTKTWKGGLSVTHRDPTDKNKWFVKRQIDQTISLHSNQPCGFTFMPDGRCSTPGTLTLLGENSQTTQIIINDSGRVRILLAESQSLPY